MADTGRYLSICHNCWQSAVSSEPAFVQAIIPSGDALWDVKRLDNGKWTLRGKNCKYLARCNNCVTNGDYSDFAFVKETNPNVAQAQWIIIPA